MQELPAGTQLGGYRVLSLIGRGGMGVVYLAEHAGLERRVALKVLAPQFATDASFRARFERESRLAAALDHPNVIPIYEAGESAGMLFIAMRYVAGPDLRAVLDREGRFDVGRTLAIGAQLAGALDAAHASGLIHRDVKPGNVLLAAGHAADGGEHVYLTDFGLTKHSASKSGLTQLGQMVGTIDYIAPEQISGEPVDGRADIYALGCVLFEMLAGRSPYARDSDLATMAAHLHEPPPRLTALRPDLPPAADEFIATALAKQPAARYASAAELVRQARSALRPNVPPTAVATVMAADAPPETSQAQPTTVPPTDPSSSVPLAAGAAATVLVQPEQPGAQQAPTALWAASPSQPPTTASSPPPAASYNQQPAQPPAGGYPPPPPGGYYYPSPPPLQPSGSGPPKALFAAGAAIIVLVVLSAVAFAFLSRPTATASPSGVGPASFTPPPSSAAPPSSSASSGSSPSPTPTSSATPTPSPTPTATPTSTPTATPTATSTATSTSTSTPGPEFDAAFGRLRQLVPLDNEIPSNDGPCVEQLDGSSAELYCVVETNPAGGPLNVANVWYTLYDDIDSLTSAYNNYRTELIGDASVPPCFRTGDEGAGTAPCEGGYRQGTTDLGSILGQVDGGSWVVWTNEPSLIRGIILDTDSDFRDTFLYWRDVVSFLDE